MRQDTPLYENFMIQGQPDRPRALWFWETNAADMEDDRIKEVMENCAAQIGYGGFAIVPNKIQDYLSDIYFQKYRVALQTAEKLGLHMCVYDENGFPSGAANGAFGEKYPEYTVQRLDKLEWDLDGAQHFETAVNVTGAVMGVVLMNRETLTCQDVTAALRGQKISLTVEDGRWKLMLFLCVAEGSPVVNYLSKEAVGKFVEMTHDAYYREFSEYFGNVIDSFFYDEPSMWGFEGPWIPGGRIVTEGRMWTPEFNAFYQEIYGENPVAHYPALWYDIGAPTAEVRRRLFACRSEMFNRHYIQTMAGWCEARGVLLTGHTWEENILNPTGTIGDLMKVFKHQHIPGIDSIAEYQCVKTTVKIVASAAYNWDKPLVMCETFGAMPEDERFGHILYKETMDLYAKGVNLIMPHAVWYGGAAYIPPELSHRGPYADRLPDYVDYVTRLNERLQGGRHVADIAVVYPVDDMQSAYNFGRTNDPCVPDYCNYTDIGEELSCGLRYDFTYLHPEILEHNCRVDAKTRTLHLDNQTNYEDYKILLFPAMRTVSVSSLKKAVEFYQMGGAVIFCGRLPEMGFSSAENQEIQALLTSLFGSESTAAGCVRRGEAGGYACFLPEERKQEWGTILKTANPVLDVEIQPTNSLEDGTLSYIHKVKEGKHVYFFANSSRNDVHTAVRIRGHRRLIQFDPHNGAAEAIATSREIEDGVDCTVFSLHLPPEKSLFFVEEAAL